MSFIYLPDANSIVDLESIKAVIPNIGDGKRLNYLEGLNTPKDNDPSSIPRKSYSIHLKAWNEHSRTRIDISEDDFLVLKTNLPRIF
jgi:hypothetical protein